MLGQVKTRPTREPGQGTEFQVTMNDGSVLIVQFPPRPRRPGEGPPGGPWWGRGPGGLLWILGIVALAVAVGTYPIIRRLTQRLDDLRMGVERWGEGDLSARIKESGSDELAFLAQRFNHAAERIESLIESHKSLLANASHELRSPLARIRMGLELMEPEGSAGIPAGDPAKHRRAGPADRRDPAGQPPGCAGKRYRHGRTGRPDRADGRGMRPRRRRAGAQRARPGLDGAGRGQAVAARHPQPAGERPALQQRSGQGRARRAKATMRWSACATADRACHPRSASASSSRSIACRAPASGMAESAWAWRWFAPSLSGITARCSAKSRRAAVPVLRYAFPVTRCNAA